MFGTLSLLETPMMVLRHLISNDSSLRLSIVLNVQVSDAQVAIGTISALYSLAFMDFEIERLLHIE